MSSILFDAPYWLVGILILAGIVVVYLGLNRRQRNLRTAGFALLGIAVLLLVFRFTIETDEKKVEKQVRQLIGYADHNEWDKAAPLMRHADFYGMSGSELIDHAKALSNFYTLSGVSLNSIETKKEPNVISVELSVTSHHPKQYIETVGSSWHFEYQKSPDGVWELTKIVCSRIGVGNTGDPKDILMRK